MKDEEQRKKKKKTKKHNKQLSMNLTSVKVLVKGLWQTAPEPTLSSERTKFMTDEASEASSH